jgi:hypothetical protein
VSVVKPVRPAGLDDESYHGAEAAAIYFLQLDAYMQATGDTTEWEAMSYKTCITCADRLDQARRIAANGDRFDGGGKSVSILHTYEQDLLTGVWPMDIRVVEEPSRIIRPDGGIAFEDAGSTYERHVEVVRKDNAWVIIGIADLKVG